MASSSAIKAGEAFVELNLRDSLFGRGLARAEKKFQAVGRAVRELNSHVTRVATGAVVAGAAMTPVVATFIDFDDSILSVKAVTGATAVEFARLRDQAMELGRTTSFTAAQVAKIMTELGRAGFKPDEIEAMTAAVLDLARATGTEAATSAGFMAATLRQFSLGAEQAARAADALATTANKSFTSLTDLGEALKYAGPVAADLGMELEDALAVLGALGNVGIQGSEAGTTLRRLSVLVASGGADVMRIFGVQSADAAGQMRPLAEVLGDVFEATKSLGNADRAAKFNEFFGILGITGASALGKNVVGVRELRAELGKAGGTASATAKEMDSGLGGAWRMLRSAAEGTAIAVGEVLAPALRVVSKVLEFGAGQATEWIARNREMAVTIGAVTVAVLLLGATGIAVTALGFAFGTLAAGVMAVVAGVKLLIAAVALVASPVGIVVAAVGGLIYLFVRATDAGKRMAAGLGQTFRNLGSIIAETFGGVAAALKKGDIELAWNIVLAGLNAGWLEFVAGLRQAWYDFANWFRDIFNDAVLAVQTMGLKVAIGVQKAVLDVAVRGVEAANKLQSRLGMTTAPEELVGRVAAETQAERKGIERETQYRFREREKLVKILKSDPPAAGTPAYEARKQTVADLEANIRASEEAEKKLVEKIETVREKIFAGDKWIDVGPFRQAREELEREGATRLKEIEETDAKARGARNKGQQERIDGIRRERDEHLKRLRELVALANKPEPEVAPMPREKRPDNLAPMPREKASAGRLEQLGESVRGLYQSADFRGALGMGPASQYAKQTADTTKEIAGILRRQTEILTSIERKTEPAMFT